MARKKQESWGTPVIEASYKIGSDKFLAASMLNSLGLTEKQAVAATELLPRGDMLALGSRWDTHDEMFGFDEKAMRKFDRDMAAKARTLFKKKGSKPMTTKTDRDTLAILDSWLGYELGYSRQEIKAVAGSLSKKDALAVTSYVAHGGEEFIGEEDHPELAKEHAKWKRDMDKIMTAATKKAQSTVSKEAKTPHGSYKKRVKDSMSGKLEPHTWFQGKSKLYWPKSLTPSTIVAKKKPAKKAPSRTSGEPAWLEGVSERAKRSYKKAAGNTRALLKHLSITYHYNDAEAKLILSALKTSPTFRDVIDDMEHGSDDHGPSYEFLKSLDRKLQATVNRALKDLPKSQQTNFGSPWERRFLGARQLKALRAKSKPSRPTKPRPKGAKSTYVDTRYGITESRANGILEDYEIRKLGTLSDHFLGVALEDMTEEATKAEHAAFQKIASQKHPISDASLKRGYKILEKISKRVRSKPEKYESLIDVARRRRAREKGERARSKRGSRRKKSTKPSMVIYAGHRKPAGMKRTEEVARKARSIAKGRGIGKLSTAEKRILAEAGYSERGFAAGSKKDKRFARRGRRRNP